MSGENSAFDLLHKNIQKWIYKNGWEELRPAQVESIKEIRQTSNHLIICSPTATGKTEAAMLPIISELLEKNIYEKSYIIYISPLKALINDQFTRLESLCKDNEICVVPWHGDISSSIKKKIDKNNQAILLITPESLEAMLINTPTKAKLIFKHAISIVIDEYGGLVWIVTLEDILETLIGLEIIDESDQEEDMQKFARQKWQKKKEMCL